MHIWTRKQTQKQVDAVIHWQTYTHTLAQFQKHSKPWTNTNTDPLVLPGKAARYHIRHVTVLSEINPVPNRSFHFFFLLIFNLYLPICHTRTDISFTLTMEALEGNWHEWKQYSKFTKELKNRQCAYSVCFSTVKNVFAKKRFFTLITVIIVIIIINSTNQHHFCWSQDVPC